MEVYIPYIVIGLSLLLIAVNFMQASSPVMYYTKAIIGLPNTIIHEFCHVFMALITFGRANSIHIFSNGEGLAVSTTGSWFSRIAVTLAGYIGASLIAYSFVSLLVEQQFTWIFTIFSAIALFTLLYIRNFFGFLYVVLLNIGWVLIVYYDAHIWQQLFTYYLVIVCLAYSFYSAAVVMLLSFQTPMNAGDATSMKEHTYLPPQLWGIVFFLQASYLYYLSLMKLIG